MQKHKFASISLTVRDRVISSKFSTHRVSNQCTIGHFQKHFTLPNNGGHFKFLNFCQKWKNTNLLLSSKPCEIEQFCRNFLPTGYLSKLLCNFQKKKIPLPPKMAAILNFLPKIQKHKFASISLTMRDRAILLKFSIHRHLSYLLLPVLSNF